MTTSERLERLLAFVEHDSGNFGLMAYAGFAHLQAQRYEEAERLLSDALAGGREAAEVRYNLAFARFMQKRYADALEGLSSAVSLAFPLALLLRARCLHHLARAVEAIADCRAHLAVAAGDAETHGLLALLLHEQGQNQTAKEHASVALKDNPQQLDAMLASASIHSQAREYEQAQPAFEALLRAHPGCGRGWLGLGLIKLSQMQTNAAKHDVELAAARMPEHNGTWHVLGWIHIMSGDLLAAEAAFQRALDIDRAFGETHGGLAVVAALQGRESEARQGIKRALKLDPQAMSARYAEIALLRRGGQHTQADALFTAFLSRQAGPDAFQFGNPFN